MHSTATCPICMPPLKRAILPSGLAGSTLSTQPTDRYFEEKSGVETKGILAAALMSGGKNDDTTSPGLGDKDYRKHPTARRNPPIRPCASPRLGAGDLTPFGE